MKKKKTLTFKIERNIPAPLGAVFDRWIDPEVPGNPWHEGDKAILDPRVDGLFYWRIMGTPHYGRFTKIERPSVLHHTWVSPHTLGGESTVKVTFKKRGEDTRMTLVHSGLPDTAMGRRHHRGWNYFADLFLGKFMKGKSKKA